MSGICYLPNPTKTARDPCVTTMSSMDIEYNAAATGLFVKVRVPHRNQDAQKQFATTVGTHPPSMVLRGFSTTRRHTRRTRLPTTRTGVADSV